MTVSKKKKAAQPEKAQHSAAATPENTDSYTYLAKRLAKMGQDFKDVPFEMVYRSFLGAGGANLMLNMPDVQNHRVRAINTLPANYSKDQIANMVKAPGENEAGLRGTSDALAWSTKTYDLILSTYADMMSYYWFITAGYSDENENRAQRMRDWRLGYKIAETMDMQAKAH